MEIHEKIIFLRFHTTFLTELSVSLIESQSSGFKIIFVYGNAESSVEDIVCVDKAEIWAARD